MLASAIALIIDALLLVQAGTPNPCISVPVTIEKSIRAFVESRLAAEDCHVRKVARGDLDEDGIEDWAIAFNVDGSCLGIAEYAGRQPGSCNNSFTSHLVLFLQKGSELNQVGPIEIGRRSTRMFTSLEIRGRILEIGTLEWDNGDALCCPSKKGTIRYTYESEILKELTR